MTRAIVSAWSGLLLACSVLAQPVNPDVTPETIKSTICVSGWTAKVRPPVSYTNKIKRELMEQAGIDWSHASELELDHHIPIEAGGSPTDPANLWLQTWAPVSPWPGVESGAHLKDSLETAIKRRICRGQIDLREAQSCIWNDWRACAEKYPAAH